jgi:hypothetical protein
MGLVGAVVLGTRLRSGGGLSRFAIPEPRSHT